MSKSKTGPRVLVLGYGNPGRQDDGLGPAAAQAIDDWHLPGVNVEANYLLNIEDAALAAEHDEVLFIDASVNGPAPFEIRPLEPAGTMTFTSHLVPPETVLAICQQCFGRVPRAWLLAIRGYEFELIEELTDRAKENLTQALAQVRNWLEPGSRARRAEPLLISGA